MAKENSFDIASQTDLNEVHNAVRQTMKEVRQRFDFKGTKSNVELEGDELVLVADDEYRLRSVTDVLEQKLVKRGVSLKAVQYGKTERAAGGTIRQRAVLQRGIPSEKAKDIVRFIRSTKLKVQTAIQGEIVRVSGRDRDTLQKVIALLRERDFAIHMEFTNYRTS